MSVAEPILFDPAVEELLREIAADPDSSLLRVPRPTVVHSLTHRQETVRPTATGLTSAERELLRVHRAEVAKLLREACVLRLSEHPRAPATLGRYLTAVRRTPRVHPEKWRERAIHLREVADESLNVFDLLDKCIAPNGVETASIAQLVAATLRLEASGTASLYSAIESDLTGESSLALARAESVLATGCTAHSGAHAWQTIGSVHSHDGKPQLARDAYEAAKRLNPRAVVPPLSLLGIACEIGSLDEVRAGEAVLLVVLDGNHGALDEYVELLRRRKSLGQLVITHQRRDLLRRYGEQLGSTARMVIDAFV